VEAFDNAAKPTYAVADWGHAEALMLLAQAQLSAGQTVAARDAIERALVIAPDYDAAQRVSQRIAEQR
jgi:Tfp pilus assembly protein PilF